MTGDILKMMQQDKTLAPIAKQLEPLQRTSIRIRSLPAVDEKVLARGTSKLGGWQNLPENVPWPVSKLQVPSRMAPSALRAPESGVPLSNDAVIALPFIAQFKLSELAAFDLEGFLPETGILYFFYNTIKYGGANAHDWLTPRHWRVIYCEDESQATPLVCPPERFQTKPVINQDQLDLKTT